MSTATLIYPHQLYPLIQHPALATKRPVYLIEEPLLLTHNPIHHQKLIWHKLTLDTYERELQAAGFTTKRLSIHEHPRTTDVFIRLEDDGVTEIHVADTTDTYLERALMASKLSRVWYESPLFLLERADACARFHASKRRMASFYQALRRDREILLTDSGDPVGGQWSFDADNRQRIPRDTTLPNDLHHYSNAETIAAAEWAATVSAEKYGKTGCWLPYTHQGALEYLETFFTERFRDFGPYEDAMTTHGVRLWHSALSPLLNIGLLTPAQVIDQALVYATENAVPINSLEGFVRQIIGWREFMRASYEVDGSWMRTQNHWGHTRTLAPVFWDGSTGILPVDHSIRTALEHGYTHHIERLMVLGNFMLLTEHHPHEVYRWFMGMYLDAYDWVMVPNVYGMSQFADGGSFATKPYISGSNYLRKLSDYPKGDWETTWTALYWRFIARHETTFLSNHRLAMMPRLLAKMDAETRTAHQASAATFLAQLDV